MRHHVRVSDTSVTARPVGTNRMSLPPPATACKSYPQQLRNGRLLLRAAQQQLGGPSGVRLDADVCPARPPRLPPHEVRVLQRIQGAVRPSESLFGEPARKNVLVS